LYTSRIGSWDREYQQGSVWWLKKKLAGKALVLAGEGGGCLTFG
jgi:hypothetical protein